MADTSKLSEMIKESLESISKTVNCDTVMGTPINTPQGATIIPISKVTLGYASGGLDYFGKNIPAADKNDPLKLSSFGGGGGTGLSVIPLGFLVVDKEGDVDLITLEAAKNTPTVVGIIDALVNMLERSPKIAAKIKNIIASGKKDDEPAEEEKAVEEVNEEPAAE